MFKIIAEGVAAIFISVVNSGFSRLFFIKISKLRNLATPVLHFHPPWHASYSMEFITKISLF